MLDKLKSMFTLKRQQTKQDTHHKTRPVLPGKEAVLDRASGLMGGICESKTNNLMGIRSNK